MKNHKIVWVATTGADLRIELVVPPGPTPFAKMTCAPADTTKERICQVECKKDRCQTGKFADDYHPGALGDYYRYAPTVGLRRGADPGIRIDP